MRVGDFLTNEKVQPGKGGGRGLVYWWDRTDYVQMQATPEEGEWYNNLEKYGYVCIGLYGGGVNAALKKKTHKKQDYAISNQHWGAVPHKLDGAGGLQQPTLSKMGLGYAGMLLHKN